MLESSLKRLIQVQARPRARLQRARLFVRRAQRAAARGEAADREGARDRARGLLHRRLAGLGAVPHGRPEGRRGAAAARLGGPPGRRDRRAPGRSAVGARRARRSAAHLAGSAEGQPRERDAAKDAQAFQLPNGTECRTAAVRSLCAAAAPLLLAACATPDFLLPASRRRVRALRPHRGDATATTPAAATSPGGTARAQRRNAADHAARPGHRAPRAHRRRSHADDAGRARVPGGGRRSRSPSRCSASACRSRAWPTGCAARAVRRRSRSRARTSEGRLAELEQSGWTHRLPGVRRRAAVAPDADLSRASSCGSRSPTGNEPVPAVVSGTGEAESFPARARPPRRRHARAADRVPPHRPLRPRRHRACARTARSGFPARSATTISA